MLLYYTVLNTIMKAAYLFAESLQKSWALNDAAM